jgi:hypothetical protein
MGRARDISKVFSTNTALATDSEISAFNYLTQASASTVYQTKASAGLTLITPTSVATTGGSATSSISATGTVTFSGASSLSLNGIFSTTYQNYKIVANVTGTTTTTLNLRFRASGTDKTSQYYGNSVLMIYNSTSFAGAALNNQSIIQLPAVGIKPNFTTIDIGNVYVASRTLVTTQGFAGDDYLNYSAHALDDTVLYDGATIYPGGGTISGTFSVYGYNK